MNEMACVNCGEVLRYVNREILCALCGMENIAPGTVDIKEFGRIYEQTAYVLGRPLTIREENQVRKMVYYVEGNNV